MSGKIEKQTQCKSSPVVFQELLNVTRIGLEGEVSAEIAEIRKNRLVADMDNLQEVASNPSCVVDMSREAFGSVFKAALAYKLLEKEVGHRLTVEEIKEKLRLQDDFYDEIFSGRNNALLPYYQLLETTDFVELVQNRRLESSYKLFQSSVAYTRQNKPFAEVEITHLFNVVSGGKLSFNDQSPQKSWDELVKVTGSKDYTLDNPLVNHVVNDIPELRVLELVGYQKNDLYVGLPSFLIQPILVANLFAEPESVATYLLGSLGIVTKDDALARAITDLSFAIKNGDLTSEQLNTACALLGKRLVCLDYDENSLTRVLEVLTRYSDASYTYATAESINKGALAVASKLYNAVVDEPIIDKTTLVLKVLQLHDHEEFVAEAIAESLNGYSTVELQGFLFLLEYGKNRLQLSGKQKGVADRILLELLTADPSNEETARVLNEIVIALYYKQFEDISALKYGAVLNDVKGAMTFGANGLIYSFITSTHPEHVDAYGQQILELESLGRLELLRTVYLNGTRFVVRKDLEVSVSNAKGGTLLFGNQEITTRTANQILEESANRSQIAIQKYFLAHMEDETVYDVVGSSYAIVTELNAEIINVIHSTIRGMGALSKDKRGVSDKQTAYLAEVFTNGLPFDKQIDVYLSVLTLLYKQNPEHFIDPKTILRDQVVANVRELQEVFAVCAAQAIELVRKRGDREFTVATSNLAYRVFESPNERERAIKIYGHLFDPHNYFQRKTYKELISELLNDDFGGLTEAQIRQEIQCAVTNYALYTQYEIDPAFAQVTIPALALCTADSYTQVLALREAAFKRVIETRTATVVKPLSRSASVDLINSSERIQERSDLTGQSTFSGMYRQSLLAIESVLEVTTFAELIYDAQHDSEIVKDLGKRLFPDFGKKAQAILALAIVQKWGAVGVELLEEAVNEISATQAQLERITELSQHVSSKLAQALGNNFYVGTPTVNTLSPFDFSHQTPVEPTSRQPILHQAKQILETQNVRAEGGLDHMKKTVLSGRNSDVKLATTACELTDWAEKVRIIDSKGKSSATEHLVQLRNIISKVSAEEIAQARNFEEVIKLGVSRCVMAQAEQVAQNFEALHQLPICVPIEQTPNIDYFIALSSILCGGLINVNQALSPGLTIMSLVEETQTVEGALLTRIETLLLKADQLLTQIIADQQTVQVEVPQEGNDSSSSVSADPVREHNSQEPGTVEEPQRKEKKQGKSTNGYSRNTDEREVPLQKKHRPSLRRNGRYGDSDEE